MCVFIWMSVCRGLNWKDLWSCEIRDYVSSGNLEVVLDGVVDVVGRLDLNTKYEKGSLALSRGGTVFSYVPGERGRDMFLGVYSDSIFSKIRKYEVRLSFVEENVVGVSSERFYLRNSGIFVFTPDDCMIDYESEKRILLKGREWVLNELKGLR